MGFLFCSYCPALGKVGTYVRSYDLQHLVDSATGIRIEVDSCLDSGDSGCVQWPYIVSCSVFHWGLSADRGGSGEFSGRSMVGLLMDDSNGGLWLVPRLA